MKILQLCLIMVIASCVFTCVIYKISIYKMKREKKRNLIMCELIKLEGECMDILNSNKLKDFSRIEKQLKEVSLILDKLSYDAHIGEIKLVKIKDNYQLIREYELLDREIRRLDDEQIKMIMLRKTIIINAIANYNFPINYYWTYILDRKLENNSNKVLVLNSLKNIFKNNEKKALQYKVT